MPFSFVHSTKSFAWRNSYTACRRPCLWGRGGSQQLQHMVGRGTSLGRLETNQSLELVGELPLFYPFGEQQGPDLTFSKQPQESKIYVIKWIFFFSPAWIERLPSRLGAVGWCGLPVQARCCLFHPRGFPSGRWELLGIGSPPTKRKFRSRPSPGTSGVDLRSGCNVSLPLSPTPLPPPQSFLALIIWRQIHNSYTRIRIIWARGPEHGSLLPERFVSEKIVRLKQDSSGVCLRGTSTETV